MNGAKVLDLGCAHGLYTLDLAQRGADALGLDGRSKWIEQANAMKNSLDLKGARFVKADVRSISLEDYGQFDIILCLGLLYHLTANEASDLIKQVFAMTSDFVIVDTQVALQPIEKQALNGNKYFGHTFPEHALGTSAEAMEAELGASLDSNHSFWFTLNSLCNLLGEVGFSTVFELKWPTDHMYRDGQFRVHEDYITVVAIKGSPVAEIFGVPHSAKPLERSPEDRSAFLLQRPWSGSKPGQFNNRIGGEAETVAAGLVRQPFSSRLVAALRALRGG